jgi:hypothetical protein
VEEGPAIDIQHGAHAEEDQLAWINYVARVMWDPYMRKAMMKRADAMFRERMGEELAKHPEVRLTELKLDFDPGKTPPTLSRMRVYYRSQQEREAVQLDCDFAWEPDEAFHLIFSCIGKAKSIPIKAENIGIAEMKISGTLSCLLSPLLAYEPCVGTGQAFFLDTPCIEMKLSGVKKLGPIGTLLTSVMGGVVSNVLAEGYILPHRFVQKLRKDLSLETMINCKTPLPLGVLQVEVLEAKNLPAADTSITGTKSSDPYVCIKIGYDQVRTSTVPNTLNPVFNDPPGHLFVYNATQIVRITVHDDDLMGTDLLGQVLGYNVVHLCKEATVPDGLWLDIVDCKDPEKPAGRLRIRVRYFDVADLGEIKAPSKKPAPDDAPYLLTVKLLGLEGEDRGDMRNARCVIDQLHSSPMVSIKTGAEDAAEDASFEHVKTTNESAVKAKSSRLMAGLEAATNVAKKSVHGMEEAAKSAKATLRQKTGLGFGTREDGAPTKRKSGKAIQWGAVAAGHLEDKHKQPLPPLAIRAMEKLHIREGWKTKDIADMFALEEKIVHTAVSLRGNFEVIWCEAVHFLQPASNPFLGRIKVSVTAPGHQQVRGADDHGYIGDALIELEPTAQMEDQAWQRRVRMQLRRPKHKTKKDKDKDEENNSGEDMKQKGTSASTRFSAAASSTRRSMTHGLPKHMVSFGETEKVHPELEGYENSGILLEVLVEIRRLNQAECQLEKGQFERSKDELREASMKSGVKISKA